MIGEVIRGRSFQRSGLSRRSRPIPTALDFHFCRNSGDSTPTSDQEPDAERSGPLRGHPPPMTFEGRVSRVICSVDAVMPARSGRSAHPFPHRAEFAFSGVEPVEQAEDVTEGAEAHFLTPAEVLDVPQPGNGEFVEARCLFRVIAANVDNVTACEFKDHFAVHAGEFLRPVEGEFLFGLRISRDDRVSGCRHGLLDLWFGSWSFYCGRRPIIAGE